MIRHISNCFSIAILLISFNTVHAQVLTFDHGSANFYTSSILSDIDATSEDIKVNLDLSTGAVDISIAIESFEFEYEMMQDHFNEEYMESDKYPEATFVGKVDQDISNLTNEVVVNVSGDLTIHGITQTTTFKASISAQDGFTVVKCKFPIVFKDYNVEEPSILTKSVAKDVELKTTLYLK